MPLMGRTQADNGCSLDSLELKALSVPASLRFLIGIEYDVVLCVTEVGTRKPFRLHFPSFAPNFKKLLTLCATRFSLTCEHKEQESVLSGTAVMPLLRYADYLPGGLHVEEILECLQVSPAGSTRRWRDPRERDAPGTSTSSGAAGNEFEAGFIDYKEFDSDVSLDDVHGLGFYLMLDYGLGLASHGHLLRIRFHQDWDVRKALEEFQEFSGWDTFDLRFYDDQDKHAGGVIVLPTTQDVCDVLERYEDEDSDDEGDLLPFVLRPVAPLVSVPSLEDSVLRKLREQHWGEIEHFWDRFPRTRNTVVVFNLYPGATLQEILAFFSDVPVTSTVFVEDASPHHRRRAFLELESTEAAKKALEVDGRNTRGSTLRVQVSPPYISASRRGRIVLPEAKEPSRAAAAPSPTSAPKASTDKAGSASPPQKKSAEAPGPSPKSSGCPIPAPRGVAAAAASSEALPAPSSAAALAAKAFASAAFAKAGTTTAAEPIPAAHLKAPAAEAAKPSPTHMNAGAKEFVPHFVLSANSPEYHPSLPPPPPVYGSTPGGWYGEGAGVPPPPSYEDSAPNSVNFSHGALHAGAELAPAYALPPSYGEEDNGYYLPPPPPPPPYA